MSELCGPKLIRVCAKCGARKVLEDFGKQTRGKYGRRTECRACQAAGRAAWYDANQDKAKARSAAWREANPKGGATWRAANPDRVKVHETAWREANPEKRKAYNAW